MALLIGAKIPLLRALQLTSTMIRFYPIEESLQTIEKDIVQGTSLHKSMEAYKIFYPRMISLIKVGEEVNKLDTFFDKIANQYTDEVEHQTAVMGNLIEPLMLIFLGAVVGTILIAMYLPLFSLSTSFS
jgi:type IV pilus assembly protein PilC